MNYDGLIDEFVESKLFEGKIEAFNFLMKINLNDEGMINLNDFVACLQSSGQDLNITHFKSFVKRIKKDEERKQKLDETREKAREQHRQRQILEVEAQEAAVREAAARTQASIGHTSRPNTRRTSLMPASRRASTRVSMTVSSRRNSIGQP